MTTPTVPETVLAPGGFHFGGAGERIRTLLGSCVAVTVWHPGRRIGGMCHYIVPGEPGRDDHDPRYAHGAMALFLARMREAGTAPTEYRAKVFGGGVQFEGVPLAINVAALNVEAGLRLLERSGIPVSARQVGGRGPREVIFDVGAGDVWVRHENVGEADR
ncbi:chemotaxis protein CheD [Mangrovihabitans endophyticus]|uniref:Probable chemoreceptor glutamine deamidase CheD n=1 Tax=Mangrovihabitans endophyticus TaxID=1751298 RepID=A0A8J3FQ72_9ACTN|nr:chemotaxis protein CheD [Mangrovihabitans endophyticus]GGL07456.1 putative chemoreceptor glutamine deamidase CheD [Mangrovihabitans endophyticus]